MICHALAALPPIALAVLAWRGELSFAAMIAYGAAGGTIAAFAIPARDGLLPPFFGRVHRLGPAGQERWQAAFRFGTPITNEPVLEGLWLYGAVPTLDVDAWQAVFAVPQAAATEGVAHATLSLPQPKRWSFQAFVRAGVAGVQIRVVNSGRRTGILRLATRALKALRAPLT